MQKIPFSLKSPLDDIRCLYADFDAPITGLDCGGQCAAHNPNGKPFCCDICHAVPAVYRQEWEYLEKSTDLWHAWRGDECETSPKNEYDQLSDETPQGMLLLACLGPVKCQRQYRGLSCRQFPFFPYITADFRFIGLACEWEFENTCWVISNLGAVTETYRQQFVASHDRLFSFSQDAFDSYQLYSERLRERCISLRRRIPLLHRNGGYYQLSPRSERMARVSAENLPRFGSYKG